MTASDFIIKKIESFEGCVLHAYPDGKYYSIGYGHNGPDVSADMVISRERAEELFKKDLQKFETGVTNTGVWSQNEFDALLDFSYNCGLGALQNIVRLDTRQDIADKMLEYVKNSSGATLPGLVARRQFDHDLFLSDEIPGREAVVTADILNVRRDPGINSEIVSRFKQGQKIRVLETWARTSAGWVSADYLKMT